MIDLGLALFVFGAYLFGLATGLWYAKHTPTRRNR